MDTDKSHAIDPADMADALLAATGVHLTSAGRVLDAYSQIYAERVIASDHIIAQLDALAFTIAQCNERIDALIHRARTQRDAWRL